MEKMDIETPSTTWKSKKIEEWTVDEVFSWATDNDGPPSKKPRLEQQPSSAVMRIEGIDLSGRSFITYRQETFRAIESALDENNVILVQSPPFSGKTSLAELIRYHFERIYGAENCILLSMLRLAPQQTIGALWTDVSGTTINSWYNKREKCLIVLDEFQLLYAHGDDDIGGELWRLMKFIDGSTGFKHIKLVAFSSYGSTINLLGTATPYKFTCTKGIELLRCTPNEMRELIEDFNKRNTRRHQGVEISSMVEEIIYNMTGGHMGLIARTLWLYQFCNYVQNEREFATFLLSKKYLDDMASQRGIPRFENLSESEKRIYMSLVLEGSVQIVQNNLDEIRKLIKYGLLIEGPDGTVSFSSPLINYIVAIKLQEAFRPDVDQVDNIEEFLVMCLQRLRQSFLQNSKGRGVGDKLLERSWQMEFFRAASSVLGSNTHISPDVGHVFKSTGFLDFYVNDKKKWAIEVTREGDGIGEHLSRFSGLYQLIETNEKVLIDFRSIDKAIRKPEAKVWYVCYNKDFSGATIRRLDKNDIVIKFLGDS
eukprot:TRINITY_DN265_c0_g3_i1.p1 TRINITY_DN265_c0_g3~~TRINITY_DN265_c0_g3_i1.p1  ORF type:complete len:539 (+),score=82.82 TRINITY_DN265_c0_g3_i1:677-2293(+)